MTLRSGFLRGYSLFSAKKRVTRPSSLIPPATHTAHTKAAIAIDLKNPVTRNTGRTARRHRCARCISGLAKRKI